MINESSNINYSLKDIEKYLKGKMSAAEMHELEKTALQDPFLSDAIEGYRETSMQTAHKHLQEIKQELLSDKEEAKIVPLPSSNSFKRWQMAAAVLIIVIAGMVTWKLNRQNNKQEGLAENKKEVVIKNDSTTKPLTTNNTRNNKAAFDKFHSFIEKAGVIKNYHQDVSKKVISANRKFNKATESADKYYADVFKNERDEVVSAPYSRKDSVLPTISPVDKEVARNATALAEIGVENPNAKDQAEIALQGKLAGVSVSKSKSKQGSENMRIRGSGTVSSKDPLYVIDGIFYDSLPPDIPPSAIKSMNVFKDAKATALYGAKAANGVVVISTNLKIKKLQGRIVDQYGKGIAGASITINPNKQNLTTDAQGNFTVKSLDSSAIASVNSIGYQPLQSVLKANQQNRIVLKDNQNLLDEVVVIGYGSQKRTSITGAISSISSKNLVALNADAPVPDGGLDNFKVYLANTIFDSTKSPLHGTIEFEFKMNTAGKAKHIHILQSPDKNKNSQIIEAVKKGPKWTVKRKTVKYKVSIIL